MNVVIFALGVALILSCFLDVRIKEAERLFTFTLVRVLLLMPAMAGVYLFVSLNLQFHLIVPLFFSENVFSLTWILMAYRLHHAVLPETAKLNMFHLFFAVAGGIVIGTGGNWLVNPPATELVDTVILLPRYGQLYLSSFFMLIAVFFMAWRLEMFWRTLAHKDRWQYNYLVIGFFLACGSLFWFSSYRLLYRQLNGEHQSLQAVLLLIAWLFVSYAVVRYRLLNRKLFVSRKVIYSAAAPIAFAGYLILLGLASLLMRAFGWSLPFIFRWLLIVMGLLFVVVLVFSGKVRATVKYFISTHFYVNKYEYRDEWLAFSSLLQGTLTEREVVDALHRILSESLYTRQILIWLGNVQEGFRLTDGDKDHDRTAYAVIASDDPLVSYLQNEPYFYLEMPGNATAWQRVISEKKDFFRTSELALVMPLTIGGQCVGLVGLGPEYTAGRYGRDDFDLLTALGSQAASAILATRTAEKLAQARETSAWSTLSAFVLHDIKNAAAMLSLAKVNAPAHIHDPEFQRDLLALIDDALKRMTQVLKRLKTLKGEMAPTIQEVDIDRILSACCRVLSKKLPNIVIEFKDNRAVIINTDPALIEHILENLLLNALEAGGPGTRVQIGVVDGSSRFVDLEIVDNGPGIPLDLLPDRLFQLFKTGKKNGSGIGLWQVKQFVECLGGTIAAENVEGGGAKFVVRLPTHRAASE
jgi:putative PEP-CTERM system histidine kinase